MHDECEHELSSFILLFGRIVWICRICFLHNGGKGSSPFGCSTTCEECVNDARRVYLPIIREKEIFRVDGPPSFVDQWFQRIYNDAWERMTEGEQQAIIEQVVMNNSRRREKLLAKVNTVKAQADRLRRALVLS